MATFLRLAMSQNYNFYPVDSEGKALKDEKDNTIFLNTKNNATAYCLIEAFKLQKALDDEAAKKASEVPGNDSVGAKK